MNNEPRQNESRTARRKRMVAEMSNVRTLQWIGVALAVHLILIVSTSIGTINRLMRDHHVFGLQPLAVTPPADEAKVTEPATQPATAPAKPVVAAQNGAPAGGPTPPGMTDDEKRLADLSKAGNVQAQKLTDVGKPADRPKEPSHGFKISEDP